MYDRRIYVDHIIELEDKVAKLEREKQDKDMIISRLSALLQVDRCEKSGPSLKLVGASYS